MEAASAKLFKARFEYVQLFVVTRADCFDVFLYDTKRELPILTEDQTSFRNLDEAKMCAAIFAEHYVRFHHREAVRSTWASVQAWQKIDP